MWKERVAYALKNPWQVKDEKVDSVEADGKDRVEDDRKDRVEDDGKGGQDSAGNGATGSRPVNASVCRRAFYVDDKSLPPHYELLNSSVCNATLGLLDIASSSECFQAAQELDLSFEGQPGIVSDDSGLSPHGCYYSAARRVYNKQGTDGTDGTDNYLLQEGAVREEGGFSTELRFNMRGRGKYINRTASEANSTKKNKAPSWPPNKPPGVLVASRDRSSLMSFNMYTTASLQKFLGVLDARLAGYPVGW
jgi:hypothetical protein